MKTSIMSRRKARAAGLDCSSPYLVSCDLHGTMIDAATDKADAKLLASTPGEWCDACREGKNPGRRRRRVASAYRRAGVRVARVNARGRTRRKRNALPRGASLPGDPFKLSTLRVVKRGGRVEKVWYQDARDLQYYYHDFEGENIMFLCESTTLGRCILIASADLKTPLWEDA